MELVGAAQHLTEFAGGGEPAEFQRIDPHHGPGFRAGARLAGEPFADEGGDDEMMRHRAFGIAAEDLDMAVEPEDAGRDADLLIAEAYTFDRPVKNHLSLKALEARLGDIRPKRLILTHMSDDMLGRLDTLAYTAASDGMIVEL